MLRSHAASRVRLRRWPGRPAIGRFLLLALSCGAMSVASIGAGAPSPASRATTALQQKVILVRHAEKSDNGADPALSAEGRVRAEQLAHVLQDAEVSLILVSQFRRTQETARPLAEARGIEPRVVVNGDPEECRRIIAGRPAGSTILVVGHSNTVPDLIEHLGVDAPAVVIEEDEFDRMFVVTPGGGTPTMVPLRYGAPSATDTARAP